jgi:hypothetical protein
MAQAPITHREGLLAQLLHDGPDDARPGENDFRPFRLQPDDGTSAVGIPRPVELDLPIELYRSISPRSSTVPWTIVGS